jgi:hypothetical protein
MFKKVLNLGIVFALASTMGCGGWSYLKTSKIQTLNKNYSFQTPQGWMELKFGNQYTLTRDSVSLQSIKVAFLDKKKALENIKQEYPENALSFEFAELYLAEFKKINESINIELMENMPVTVAGQDGFRLHLKTQNNNGVAYQIIITGLATKEGLYTLTYEAPTIRYFDMDIENYERVTKSFVKKT